eukprot:CAMPEP_0202892216 /NCGR_PEP_ID=MMETSP1392-20130828/1992_1 /ASSEMBLY_ACC=CAM_ASM_000868 /TAXON_ID=225041 /ORGANISM="Chlamydomonas chlamydogama, Strain SAG 11-48b" /LENGTH=313 /DNA_ID=CAMNT_0049576105 /DNA_START=62 /DNA_END=1000 /DNA_ORIENTATION=-
MGRPILLCWCITALFVPLSQAARLAVIGDFGQNSAGERATANMVHSWANSPGIDAVVTTGDNSYPSGLLSEMQTNVGNYYHRYMFPFFGSCTTPPCGSQDKVNRFWPCPGNHDYGDRCPGSLAGYLTYMPVNGKAFYDVILGDIHVFLLDSDCNQNFPGGSGNSANSVQAAWLKAGLAASTTRWKLVVFHHPAYSSGSHGNNVYMQWPFEEWGAHAVLAGHDHHYERILRPSGFPHFVNGFGGAGLRSAVNLVPGSVVRVNMEYGAQLVESTDTTLTFKAFVSSTGYPLRDCYQIVLNEGVRIYNNCPQSPAL